MTSRTFHERCCCVPIRTAYRAGACSKRRFAPNSPVRTLVEYKTDAYYAPEHERSILWNDAELAIDWPLPEGVAPLLSSKDRAAVAFKEAETFP